MKIHTEKKVRITLDLSPQFYERLERLERLVDADSKSNLIRQALQLYEFVAKRSQEGYEFSTISPTGKEQTLVFFGPIAAPNSTEDEDTLATTK